MALISLQDVVVSFGGPAVLTGVSLHIERGERVCLLGRNGEGKSTLLRLMRGDFSADSGDIVRQPNLQIAYVPQEIPPCLTGTVLDIVVQPESEPSQKEPEPTRAGADTDGIWQPRQLGTSVLSQLQVDPTAPFASLSGGLKRRVLLARALAQNPDLLLLDEPTNHLDIDAISWLETALLRRSPTLLCVTHDRMLLSKLATRIVELDRGHLTSWSCDYDTFVQRKAAMLEVEAAQWAEFDKKLAQEETWIRQGIKARRTRNEGRVRALQKLRDMRRARREQPGPARLQSQESERSGKLVIEAKGVSFSYDGRPLIQNFSTLILRGDKVGILGANGSGKTTLLRLLLQELAPQQGTVRLGARLQMAYFDQLREQLNLDKTAQDNVADGSETVMINGRARHILSYLQDFLFTPERARSPVRILSGGERNRLLLARLLAKPSNLVVLDEPTNDLDLETLELLEELLLDYPGTVLLVSHDRAFLNHVVTSTLVLEGQGRVKEYVGGYDDWWRQRQPSASSKGGRVPTKSVKPHPQPARPRRLTYKERRELEALPQHIETLEAEQEQLYQAMSGPTFYRQDSHAIVTLKTRLAALEGEIEAAYARWELLETLEN
jgi:ATP-binding cassette subfamily F protein uup